MRKRYGRSKKGIRIILSAVMVLSMAACSNQETKTEELQPIVESIRTPAIQEMETPTPTPDSQPVNTPMPTQDQLSDTWQEIGIESLEDWGTAYLEYLESLEDRDFCTYSFLYVDEDAIPELEINTGYCAGGSLLLTYHDGVLDEVDIYRSGLYYIEKGNLICNGSGNMGSYYDYVYTIQDGRWKQIGCGEYREDYEGSDEYLYEWDGESVTEEEYKQKLQDIYPEENSKEPDGHYYIYKDISSLLKTGKVASANHKYEFLETDMTWTEAEAACRRKGGYLATITSWEEFEQIQEQIIQEEKTDISFWIGAMCGQGRKNYGFLCLEPGMDLGYNMASLSNALWRGFWWGKEPDGEPSYNGLTEAGEEIREGFVMMRYCKEDGRYFYWDMPDDVLDARPSLTGQIGYICEYDGWQEIPGTEHMGEWKKAYLEYLDSYDDRDIAEYAFLYVDEDDIPELAVSSGWMLNSKVLTFHDDKVNALEISYFTVHYMERENRLYYSGSHMGETNALYYTLCNGQWELVGSGKLYELGWYELDEDGNEVDEYIYEWDGEEVTEEEYEQREKEVFPAGLDEHQHPVYLYSYDELHSLLGGE